MKPTDRELDDTLAETSPSASHSGAPSRDLLSNYALGDVIGRGGMGEVVQARDLRIGRDVAIKRMRGAGSEEAVARFLREAKIQARLDHPAIVPVHELGTDAEGEPYFTMKRLVGVTLATLLEAKTESRERLLRAFVDVALAVDLAHSKRIVHRDLKPANIMLGDYGEVYVLDWGLARDIDEASAPEIGSRSVATPLVGVTAIGSVLGTPGYMPPEQIKDASSVGISADSYALGSILFEILTGEPLHARTDPLISTLEGVDPSPRERRPEREIPPELDRLCREALAAEPSARPTARVLAEQVQQYLDGDRDLATRRAFASQALERARVALSENRQDDAMRDAGRALALDPSSPAAEIVSRLMLEPPDLSLPELVAEFRVADIESTSRHAKHAIAMFLTLLPMAALAAWNGIRSWTLVGSIVLLAGVLSFTAFRISREPTRAKRELWAYAVANAVLMALLGRLVSPFLIAPGITCVVIMSIVTYPDFGRRGWLVLCGVSLGWAIPVVLELGGALRPTWDFAGGTLTIRSYALELGGSTTLFILVAALVVFLAAGILAVKQAKTNREMQRQLIAQRWRLSHLIPRSA